MQFRPQHESGKWVAAVAHGLQCPFQGKWRQNASDPRPLPSQPGEQYARLSRPSRPKSAALRCGTTCSSRRSAISASTVAAQQEACHLEEIGHLQGLAKQLQCQTGFQTKTRLLEADSRVQLFSSQSPTIAQLIGSLPAEQAYVLLCLPAMGQQHILQRYPAGDVELRLALCTLANVLLRADTFYSSLGGIVGYQAKCLELIQHNRFDSVCSDAITQKVQFHMPQGPDLDGENGRRIAAVEAAKGLEALPHMAEIWPLGGAGDRLGLECERTGKSVPTAMLRYCGRTLLEGLVRDLQAREHLYYKVYSKQHITPVVIMTSEAKDNHRMVLETLEQFDWFGRGKESFRVICQPMVPVVSASSGRWLLPQPLMPMLKPGGHGAIWKLMLDEGVFSWLSTRDRQAALVRQISNPMAGTDATMLALTGAGYADGRTFGFASCERTEGATEGMNVLMQRRLAKPDGSGYEHAYNVSNVEYTEFERLAMTDDQAEDPANCSYPANTNILYVNLKAAEAAVRAGVAAGGGAALPGMIFNGKKTVTWTDAALGKTCTEPAGRMECTMQNLVDSLAQRFQEPIPVERHAELGTFVVFNKRRRVTSSAKRKRVPGSNIISQTPDGSFLDLMRNAADVLQRCSFSAPEVGDVERYLKHGPGFLFLFHPALGPLWDVIAQKLRGGVIAPGSELVLEVGEAAIADLRLDGSLVVEADCIYGPPQCSHDGAGQDSPHVAGQSVTYQDSGSEAIQYSVVMPDLRTTSGTVVPLQRKKILTVASVGGTKEIALHPEEKAHQLQAVGGSSKVSFSPRCARVRMTGVVVKNRGIDWEAPGNLYWQHKVERHEQVRIVLRGQSEFEASHVVLKGSHTFEVPDGYKMVVSAAPGGGLRRALYPLTGRRPSWQWRHLAAPDASIQLHMEEPASSLPGVPLSSRPMHTELPFTYMI